MHAKELRGREARLRIALVALDLVRHTQLLEKPEDAMGARVLEVVDGDHGPAMIPVITLRAMTNPTTPFSVLLSRIQAGEGESTLDVPEDWLQGRTLFGGLQAVVGLAAMRSLAPEAPLRSLEVTVLAPVHGR